MNHSFKTACFVLLAGYGLQACDGSAVIIGGCSGLDCQQAFEAEGVWAGSYGNNSGVIAQFASNNRFFIYTPGDGLIAGVWSEQDDVVSVTNSRIYRSNSISAFPDIELQGDDDQLVNAALLISLTRSADSNDNRDVAEIDGSFFSGTRFASLNFASGSWAVDFIEGEVDSGEIGSNCVIESGGSLIAGDKPNEFIEEGALVIACDGVTGSGSYQAIGHFHNQALRCVLVNNGAAGFVELQ